MAIAVPRVVARNITFKIGSTSYAPEVNLVSLTLGDAPGGIQTMTEVRVQGEWALQLDGYVSQEADSLYRLLWSSFGTELAFEINPGGGTIGADNPSYKGTIIVNELPPLELTANEEVSFSVTLRVKNTGLDVASNLFYGVTIDITP
jgi:hypothetical protein